MNDRRKENASRIAEYLENRLSPQEREAFKRDLGEDDELRLQYVDALMNRVGTAPNAGGTGELVTEAKDPGGTAEPVIESADPGGMVEPVDDIEALPEGDREVPGDWTERAVEEVREDREPDGNWQTPGEQGPREAWEEGWPRGKKGVRRGFLGSGWMVGLAALLLIIAGVVMFTLIRREGFWDRTIAVSAADSGNVNRGNGMDSAAGKAVNGQVAAAGNAADSAASGAGAGGKVAGGATGAGASGKGGLADSVYARLYKPYMRGDDPVDVREYYRDYRTGNYAAVLAAGDSMVMKISPQRLLVRDYMRLYLGLSYLASGDGRNAVRELEGVVLRTKPGDVLYEAAKWYLALAWLKRNDVDPTEARGKAIGLARDISHSYSRYQRPARELMKAIGS
jgi:hypothetical protein